MFAQMVFRLIPKKDRPHKGRVRSAVRSLLPVLEDVFNMPAAGPARGSKQWIRLLKDNPEMITFRDAVENSNLRRVLVQCIISRCFTDNGNLRLNRKECIPTGKYNGLKEDGETKVKPSDVLKETRRSMTYDRNLEFLRSGGVSYATLKLRNDGLIPMKMKRDTLPPRARNAGYCNFNKFIVEFYVYYCHAQGLSRSSEKARQVCVILCLRGCCVTSVRALPYIQPKLLLSCRFLYMPPWARVCTRSLRKNVWLFSIEKYRPAYTDSPW